MKNSLSQLFSLRLLHDLAGETSYSRGEEYFEEGRVGNIQIKEDSMHAKVHGSQVYRVDLWNQEGKLNFSCTCPFHKDNLVFCKHCVAVGLAILKMEENNDDNKKIKGKYQSEMSIKDVKAYLKTQDKDALISMLLRYSNDNDELKSQLLLKAGTGRKKIHIPTLKKAIERAVDWGDFVDYKSMYEYSRGIEHVTGSLQELLKNNYSNEVIELTDYFLTLLEDQMGMMDDSDGSVSEILYEIQELHHTACVKAKPDPEQLARKLFNRELHSEWEVFYGASRQYADVLGKSGLAVYRELAEKEWEKVPQLKPGEDRHSFVGTRFRITSIMESLAEQTNDIEKIVAIKTKDLSLEYSFLQIAEIYKKAGHSDKALEWAERGVKAFPKETDSRLREFLANEYHQRKRHTDAMRLVWAEFVDRTRFEEFKLLKIHAKRGGGDTPWKEWREKAIQYIREQVTESKRKTKNNQWFWNGNDHSELVKIYLWEKDIDSAWNEAQQGGCHESLWLELAEKREAQHPEDAVAVYQSLVEPHVRQMNNVAYKEAAAWVKKVGVLFKRLGREEEWNTYLNNLRTAHKKKRNFMALLKNIQ